MASSYYYGAIHPWMMPHGAYSPPSFSGNHYPPSFSGSAFDNRVDRNYCCNFHKYSEICHLLPQFSAPDEGKPYLKELINTIIKEIQHEQDQLLNKLVVECIPVATEEDALRKIFQGFGEIESLRFLKEQTNQEYCKNINLSILKK